MEKKKVLFVGYEDICRSYLLLVAFNLHLTKMGITDYRAETAGVCHSAHRSHPPHQLAVAAAARLGQRLDHQSRWFAALKGKSEFDLFVCVDEEVAGHVVASDVPRDRIVNAHLGKPQPADSQAGYDGLMARITPFTERLVSKHFRPPLRSPQ